MKITADDPNLTAFVLGELDESAAVAVERALDADEALREEAAVLEGLTGLLSATLGAEKLTLGEERIAEIHKAGQRPDSKVIVLEHHKKSRRQSFYVVAGVAAVVVAGFFALSQFQVEGPMGGTTVVDGGQGEVAGGVTVAGTSAELPGSRVITAAGSTAVPIGLKRANPTFVERALLEKGTLPAPREFQIADWVNLAPVPEEAQLKLGRIGVSAHTTRSPWSPEKLVVMLQFWSLDGGPVSFEASLKFDPARVGKATLLGGNAAEDDDTPLLGQLASPQTLLYEIDPLESAGGLGVLNLTSASGELGYHPLSEQVAEVDELSTAFQCALVLADYAKWAASAERDRDILKNLAERSAGLLTRVTDSTTRYALDLILQTEEVLGGK